MPGRSFTRPPRISTIECSCRLWPTPGMYVVTSMPLVKRTRATLRSAEFGFFGVWVYTRVHTPRFCGQDCRAGRLVLRRCPSVAHQLIKCRHSLQLLEGAWLQPRRQAFFSNCADFCPY